MVSFKTSSIVAAAVVLLSPRAVSACVIFSLNVNYGGPYSTSGLLNAGLTDDGDQKCSIVNQAVASSPSGVFNLQCKTGYEASFNFDNGWVHYHHGSFTGDFPTSEGFNAGEDATYWTSKQWGC